MMLLGGCSGSGEPGAPGTSPIQLTAAADAVFVGERTQLVAVFDGSGSIEGIGPVQSGVPVDTPILSRTTRFTLRVSNASGEAETSATVEARYRNRIRVLDPAPIAQTAHLAAALPGGRAMVMGGNTSASVNVPDSTLTQIFDAATERFTPGPDLPFTAEAPRTSVVALGSGGFLLVGTGTNAGAGPHGLVITEKFDAAAGTFTRVGDAATDIPLRMATALSDGGALLSGGFTDAVDRYDPTTGQWRAIRPIRQVRALHSATLLRDGRVLIAGGLGCCNPPDPSQVSYLDTAEIYDPATDAFTPAGSMSAARGAHAAALLADGRVLISGGTTGGAAPPPLDTEIFDPASGRFSSAGKLQAPRDSHAAVTLADGRVLVIGGRVPSEISGSPGVGLGSTEIFDPQTGLWSAGPTLAPAFYAATVTLLSNGKVLVFGGQDAAGFPQSAAALFE